MFDSKFEKEEFVKNNFKNILETRHHSISKYIFQEFFQQLLAYENFKLSWDGGSNF